MESPFFGAALAGACWDLSVDAMGSWCTSWGGRLLSVLWPLSGCRWECAFFTTGADEAGMRLSFQAFSDNLPSFAADAARAIGQHEGPEDLELVRRLALTELKTLRTAEAKDLKGALEQMQKEEIQRLFYRKYFS